MNTREIKFRAWDGNEMREMKTLFLDIKYKPEIKIMQYTGLKDKNNKEIYEGDFICAGESFGLTGKVPKSIGHIPKGKPLKVFFHEGAFKFRHNKRSLNHYLSGASIRYFGLEVIGNIYERPHLIKNQIEK